MDTKQYPPEPMTQVSTWEEGTRRSVKEILQDPIIRKLLERSSVTRAQYETLLIDQLGHDMANKRLTRNEMAQAMRKRGGISRGALNRTLSQGRKNLSEAIHTVLLLGYTGLFDSPSLAPFVEASEQLKSQTIQLREASEQDVVLYQASIEKLLANLEDAFEALYGRSS